MFLSGPVRLYRAWITVKTVSCFHDTRRHGFVCCLYFNDTLSKKRINSNKFFRKSKSRFQHPRPTRQVLWMLILQFHFMLLIRCLLYQVSMAYWRNGHPPVRFDDPVHHVLPRHRFVLSPFPGQPRKYKEPRRLPGLQVRKSSIRGAGNGLWLAERVRKGQTITIFRRKRISEAAAKKLQKKVPNDFV